jgi:hypothetical protein
MSTTLVNVSTRPVELHLLAGVTVLQPAERYDCADEDFGSGQIAALLRRGVLSALPPHDDDIDDDTDETDDDTDDTDVKASGRKGPARRGSRRKPAESS